MEAIFEDAMTLGIIRQDLSYKKVMSFHARRDRVLMWMGTCPEFNSEWVDAGLIIGSDCCQEKAKEMKSNTLRLEEDIVQIIIQLKDLHWKLATCRSNDQLMRQFNAIQNQLDLIKKGLSIG